MHGKPEPGKECLVWWIDIDESNYCEYRTNISNEWKPSNYCEDVVRKLLSSQFHDYTDAIDKATCKAHIKKLVEKGPPIYIHEQGGFPVEEGEYVEELWFSSTNEIVSGVLDGTLQGKKRMELWNTVKTYYETLPNKI